MDYSLVHDHDLNLNNNYAHNDYLSFYPAPLSPLYQVGAQKNGNNAKSYSIHGIGLPILLVPGYFIAAAKGAIVEMVIIATAVLWLTWLWVRNIVGSEKLAYLSAGCLFVCYFFNGLAGYIYPDLPIALLTLGSLIIIDKYYDKIIYQVLFGFMISALVFMHFKTLVVAVPLLAAIVYRHWHKKQTIPWAAIIPFGLLTGYFFVSLHQWFGVWEPNKIYPSIVKLKTSPAETIPAMLFDAGRGLIVYNPITLLIFVGLYPWYKKHKDIFLIVIICILPSIGLLAIFNQWQGGYAPMGRYIMDFLPVFMPALALSLKYLILAWEKFLVFLIFAATLFISTINLFIKIAYVDLSIYRTRPQLFAAIQKHTGFSFDRLLPNFSNQTTLGSKVAILKVFLGFLLLMAATFYGFLISKRNKTRIST